MGDYKKLAVWEKGHQLALACYQATGAFPKEEMYGLTSQIRRAAASIPANIAEGSGRGGDAEMIRFLRIAMGSAYEVEYHILLAHDLDYIDKAAYGEITSRVLEVQRMLAGLIQKLDARHKT